MHNQNVYSVFRDFVFSQIKTEEATRWTEQTTKKLTTNNDPNELSMSIALSSRFIPNKNDKLKITQTKTQEISSLHPSLKLEKWSLLEAIRVLFNLSATYQSNNAGYIFYHAYKFSELAEQVAFLKGLALYKKTNYVLTAAENAVRSNTQSIFAAVSQFNPYPADYFTVHQWNNMVLKAVSWNYPLQYIHGIDKRTNKALMKMLCEYARELSGANRKISIDLWRCVGPFADKAALADLNSLLCSSDINEQYAAALALESCMEKKAKDLLESKPNLIREIRDKAITWESLTKIKQPLQHIAKT